MSLAYETAPAPAAAGPAVGSALLVDVVVLSNDLSLFESAREAIGERNPVWRARSAEEAADLLLTGRCGVLLVDMQAVSTRADTLIVQIVDQFPDVVVCVAGSREDEPMLVPLISDGLVYRFMHTPLSPRRAGMFLQAAIRQHVERRDGLQVKDPLAPMMRRLARPAASMKWLYLATAIAAIAIIFGYQMPRPGTTAAPGDVVAASTTAPAAAVPLANPVLSRARAALAAGRYESPAGRNALDLFHAVLLEQPDHAEALAGMQQTLAHVLAQARKEAAAGRRDEADRLLQRVLSVDPRRTEALALARELHPPVTPSSHLAAEQLAAAQLAATKAAEAPARAVAGVAPTRGQVDAATTTTAAVPPVPGGSPRAIAAPATQAVAAGKSTSTTLAIANAQPVAVPPPRPVRVMPDPLAPKFTNLAAASGRRDAALPSGKTHAPRAFGAPISPSLPIAGYVRDAAPPVAATALEAETARKLQYAPVDELDRIEARDPVYPRQALASRTHGWVELEFTITGTGTVRDITVVDAEPSGVFDRAATDALATWRFRPRLVNGQPVLQRSSITMRFDVDD